MKMRIEYANGRKTEVDNEDAAREIIDAKYPDAEYGDWQQSGYAPARMLIWADAASAVEDDGQHAVAAIYKTA